jgi:DNA-binding GntR family transcriptional regulator
VEFGDIDRQGWTWPYEQVAAVIAAAIESGELPRGKRLPSQERLAQMAGVSKRTVQNALAVLKEQGTVHARPGLGTFAGPPPAGD